MVIFYSTCLLYKYGTLIDEPRVQVLMSTEQRHDFVEGAPELLVTLCFVVAICSLGFFILGEQVFKLGPACMRLSRGEQAFPEVHEMSEMRKSRYTDKALPKEIQAVRSVARRIMERSASCASSIRSRANSIRCIPAPSQRVRPMVDPADSPAQAIAREHDEAAPSAAASHQYDIDNTAVADWLPERWS